MPLVAPTDVAMDRLDGNLILDGYHRTALSGGTAKKLTDGHTRWWSRNLSEGIVPRRNLPLPVSTVKRLTDGHTTRPGMQRVART